MTRTITRVTSTRHGYVVNWCGEKDIDLFIAKPADAPRVGDVITFRDAPAAGRLQPRFTIRRNGDVG